MLIRISFWKNVGNVSEKQGEKLHHDKGDWKKIPGKIEYQ